MIDLTEVNEKEFSIVKNSIVFSSNEIQDNKIIKLKNLPYLVNTDTIKSFLKNYNVADNGIKFSKNHQGKNLSECVVVFNEAEEAKKVIKEKNGELLSNQHVYIEQSTVSDFEDFSSSGSICMINKVINNYITPEKVTRSLFVYNLP